MLSPRLSDQQLLRKYAGGAVPPLVDPVHPEMGLVHNDLVEIYQRGFSGVHNVALGILLAHDANGSLLDGWASGDFHYNARAKKNWPHVCSLVRGTQRGNAACERCDREHAPLAEKRGSAVAYLCTHGMIDFAVPVHVGALVGAVLFSGQVLPAENCDWPPDLVQIDDSSPAASKGLWSLSGARLALVGQYEIPKAALDEALTLDESEGRGRVYPEDVRQIIDNLNSASRHLSDLATNTFALEKSRVASYLRSEFTRPLATLKDDLSSWGDAVAEVSDALDSFRSCIGSHCVALCREDSAGTRQIVADAGLANLSEADRQSIERLCKLKPSAGASNADVFHIEPEVFASPDDLLATRPSAPPRWITIKPKGTRMSVIAGPFAVPDRYGAHVSYPLIIDWVLRVAPVAALVTDTLFLLRDLHQSHLTQDQFIEDVAHDIASPVQNVLNKATLLKRAILDPKDLVTHATKLAAQVMRIHLVARRVWTAQRMHRGSLVYHDDPTSPRDAVSKVFDALRDVAIGVDLVTELEALDKLPRINVDGDLLFEVMLNLVQNGVKYSSLTVARKPYVLVCGKSEGTTITLTVSNRGIGITEEEKFHIFERYYRTPAARRVQADGSGIGLSVVAGFAKHYGGGVDVKSIPMKGTTDYLTLFSLTLPVK